MWTRSQLETALRSAGLRPGDHVVVHSSLRAVGPVHGGAEAIIESLIDVTGPDGTVAMPAFHGTRPLPEPYFDLSETPSRSGTLSELFRQYPDSLRSVHPTHSVTARGKRAAEFLADHLGVEAVGLGSPLDRIARAGGYVLLIGVSHQSNTTIHCGEAHSGVRKFWWTEGPPPVAKVRLPDGALIEHPLDCSSSCSWAFNAIDYWLRHRQTVRDFSFGHAAAHLVRGQDVIAATVEAIRTQPDILFCTRTDCRPCSCGRDFARRAGTLPADP